MCIHQIIGHDRFDEFSVFTSTRACIGTHAHLHTHTHTHMHTQARAHTHTCSCTHAHTRTKGHMQTYNSHMYACICTPTHNPHAQVCRCGCMCTQRSSYTQIHTKRTRKRTHTCKKSYLSRRSVSHDYAHVLYNPLFIKYSSADTFYLTILTNCSSPNTIWMQKRTYLLAIKS